MCALERRRYIDRANFAVNALWRQACAGFLIFPLSTLSRQKCLYKFIYDYRLLSLFPFLFIS